MMGFKMAKKKHKKGGIIVTKEIQENFEMNYNKGYIIFISLVVALGGFLLGFDSAVISGAIPFISEQFRLNELQTGSCHVSL